MLQEGQEVEAAWVAWGSVDSEYTGCLQIPREGHPPWVECQRSLGKPGGGMQAQQLGMPWERQTVRFLKETMKSGSVLAVLA